MDSWDIIRDLMNYTNSEYPDIDIRTSKKKCRRRSYEKMIIDEIMLVLMDHVDHRYMDPMDILEDYEIVYIYYNAKMLSNDIYKFQLKVIRKMLMFLERRKLKYG